MRPLEPSGLEQKGQSDLMKSVGSQSELKNDLAVFGHTEDGLVHQSPERRCWRATWSAAENYRERQVVKVAEWEFSVQGTVRFHILSHR